MVTFLFEAHSGWRYIVIVVAIAAFLKLLMGLLSNSKWGAWDQRLGAALPIVMDIQFLLGLVLWVAQGRWNIPDPTRTWEHPVTMLLAIAIAHITWTRVKRETVDSAKFRTGVIGYAIAGLLVAVGIARVTGFM